MKTLSVLAVMAVVTAAPSAASTRESLVFGRAAMERCFQLAQGKERSPAAIDTCTVALDTFNMTSDERAGTLVNRGIIRMLAKQPVNANLDFDAALEIDPNLAEAWLNKGVNDFRIGDSASALRYADRALALHTNRPAVAYYVRGLANEDTGNLRAAYNDLQSARRIEPQWQEPSAQLARYQVRKN